MKTYYIKIEEQGCVVAIVKVNANSYQEAELKALKALHATENISEISKEEAEAEFESGNVDVMIDEDGCEIDLDELEGE